MKTKILILALFAVFSMTAFAQPTTKVEPKAKAKIVRVAKEKTEAAPEAKTKEVKAKIKTEKSKTVKKIRKHKK